MSVASQGTLLKMLLRERHWQKYGTFCKQWDDAARSFDETLVGTFPSRSQLARWLAGGLKNQPHPDACRVLEAMFPGKTINELFGSTGPDGHTMTANEWPRKGAVGGVVRTNGPPDGWPRSEEMF